MGRDKEFSRAGFLSLAAALSCTRVTQQDEHARRAHLLLSGKFPEPSSERTVSVVIAGAGISGLSAAWWLGRSGRKNFEILELDSLPGGNSTWGANAVSPFPWGAHYLPLPGVQAVYVRALLEELGVITGYERGLPVYDEFALCADPQERLYFRGAWQEGIVPEQGLTTEEKRQTERFLGRMSEFREASGRDGRKAFTIPLDFSSRDPEFTSLDSMSMREFLRRQGFTAPPLLWYAGYCCRDDYGSDLDHTSAWAGIHYFAARGEMAANARADNVLTWPEGNGWLAKNLAAKAGRALRTGMLVYRIEPAASGARVYAYDTASGQSTLIRSAAVIFAAPAFVAKRVIPSLPARPVPDYSPWMVANITLSAPPGPGVLAWDNVRYGGAGLGYVNAGHQSDRRRQETVITYYLPIVSSSPAEARIQARDTTGVEWTRRVIEELEIVHPGIEPLIQEVTIRVLGHGMVRPAPGFLWGRERGEMQRPHGSIFFAHSDMSGISNFEEAQYRGIEAAKRVMAGGLL